MDHEKLMQHLAAILKAHPDAFQIAKNEDYQGWLMRQSPIVQTAIERGTAEEVIQVLDRYKRAVGITRKKPHFTRQQIEAMPLDEFRRREEEIDKAIAAGNIT